MRRRAIAASCVLLVASAFACGDSVFNAATSDQGDAATANDASGDGASGDAAFPEAGNNDAAVYVPVPGNVLSDPSFEDGSGDGCGVEWNDSNASTSLTLTTAAARSGSHSCLVCAGAALTPASIETNPVAPFDGGIWVGSAYVMVAPTGASSSVVQPLLGQTFFDAGPATSYGTTLAPGSVSWTQVYVNASIRAGKQLRLGIVGTAPLDGGTGCYLVDDVSLVLQQ